MKIKLFNKSTEQEELCIKAEQQYFAKLEQLIESSAANLFSKRNAISFLRTESVMPDLNNPPATVEQYTHDLEQHVARMLFNTMGLQQRASVEFYMKARSERNAWKKLHAKFTATSESGDVTH